MKITRMVEYAFFFGLLALAGYMVWLIAEPFLSSLALAAIIVTICYPLYERIKRIVPRQNKTAASLLTTLLVLVVIIIPLVTLSSLVVREIATFFQDIEAGQVPIEQGFAQLEILIQSIIPGYEIDLTAQLGTVVDWATANSWSIFAGTISFILVFFIALIGTFYFFRDGKEFLELVIKASPLPDKDDAVIFRRLARSVRAVATGTILTALIQGTLVAVGFSIFGVDRAILWGSLASVTAVMPGIGTTVVSVPAVIMLFVAGDIPNAFGLLLWSMLIVGMVDNIIAPYLIGRGNNLHPFIVLISVLGGVILFGPIGFVIGPVIVTFFLVLLEIYNQYIIQDKVIKDT
jgi:predicted PurR-regulated permease PerM